MGVRDDGDTLPVRSRRHDPLQVASLRGLGHGASGSRSVSLRVPVIAVATAGAVLLAGGGNAFWVCVPTVLLAGAASRTRLGAGLSTATVIAAAASPSLLWVHGRPLPSPLLALLVPSASVAVLVAVRERLEREHDALRDFALTDPLTGIANRRLLLAHADYEIARHTRARHSFALVMLDLDGFKLLNDRFGHAAGDDLLRDVAEALERSIRAQDTVARMGGDEFCLLAPETDESGTRRLATRLEQATTDVTAGVENLRASMGIAVFPSDGTTAKALLLAADQRLLSAKRERQRGRTQRRAA
jgi:diguanylate cyclase (GGDEF)-like protein